MRKSVWIAGLVFAGIAAGFAGGAQLRAQQGSTTKTIEAQEIILRSPNGQHSIALRAQDDRCGLYLFAPTADATKYRELGIQVDPNGLMTVHFFGPGDKEPRMQLGLGAGGKPWVRGLGLSEDVRQLADATWRLSTGTPGDQVATKLTQIRDRNAGAAQTEDNAVQRVGFPR